jgi:signal transduction histidine kinase
MSPEQSSRATAAPVSGSNQGLGASNRGSEGQQMKNSIINTLLVEDNPGDVLLLTDALSNISSQQFHLTHVESLENALQCIKALSFDIAFLDLNILDSQGLETLERFHERAPRIPVIVLTGNDDEALGIKAVQLGAADYMVKGQADSRLLTRSVSYSMERHHILEKLQEYDQMKSALISTASHELRTPLTIIQEYVSLVMDGVAGPVTSEQTECLTAAIRNCHRLTALLNNLLDMSKLNSDNVEIEPQITDLNAILQECHNDFQAKSIAKDLRMELEIPEALPMVFCDPDRIRQVLVNLLSNAVKFTQEGGGITLSARTIEDFVSIEVVDNGKGISLKDQESIFKAFTQIDRQDGPGAKGTGLGLAITKRIVELHGGEIGVTSDLGRGSRFTFGLQTAARHASMGRPRAV